MNTRNRGLSPFLKSSLAPFALKIEPGPFYSAWPLLLFTPILK